MDHREGNYITDLWFRRIAQFNICGRNISSETLPCARGCCIMTFMVQQFDQIRRDLVPRGNCTKFLE